MSKRGLLTVISGFSGSGKGTVVNELVKRYGYSLSISATTRKAREGEIDGVHYFFKTEKEFMDMIDDHGLIEWVKYIDNYYGTPRNYVNEMLDQGKDIILEIEMQGGLKVKANYKDALLIFMTPPSASVLKERLIGRGTEDMTTINKRLHRASEETVYIDSYDYLIVNDNLDDCVNTINRIINVEKQRIVRNNDLLNYIKNDFSNI